MKRLPRGLCVPRPDSLNSSLNLQRNGTSSVLGTSYDCGIIDKGSKTVCELPLVNDSAAARHVLGVACPR